MRDWLPLSFAAAAAAVASCHPAPAARVPPSSQGALWIEPARASGAGVWFAEELNPVADAVAQVLARQGYEVIANQRLRELRAAAQQGILPGRSSRCVASPPPSLLSEVVFAGARRAEVEVRCEDNACNLHVRVMEPARKESDDEREAARFGLKLRPGQHPVAWARTIASSTLLRLPPPPPQAGGLLGILGGLLNPGQKPGNYTVVHDLTQVGAWSRTLASQDFQPHADTLMACEQGAPRWRDWWGQQFVLEVTPAGKVSRCEPSLPDHLPPPGFACACGVLRTMDFGVSNGPRRAQFYLDVTTLQEATGPADPMRRSAFLAEKQSTDRSATLGTGELDGTRMAACLRQIDRAIGEVNVPLIFDVGSEGNVVKHEAQWPPQVPEPVRACLDKELAGAGFNCPLSGSARISAKLSISVQ